MIKRVKVTEIAVKYIDVNVDSADEAEIRAELDYMSCEGKIDWDDFDDYEQKIEVMNEEET